MNSKINVLGQVYTIYVKKYDEDPIFKANHWEGYCGDTTKTIVIGDLRTFPGSGTTPNEILFKAMKKNLRHEIVHAFLNESGLGVNTHVPRCPWTQNEEMVDWFAIQLPKIYKVMNELELI